MADAVSVATLSKSFGDFVAVDDVSFTVRAGEIFGFLGPNGAGKTTTIKMLTGLVKPTHGSATVVGFDVLTEAAQLKSRVGYMSQMFSLYADLTVIENRFLYGAAGRNLYGYSLDEEGAIGPLLFTYVTSSTIVNCASRRRGNSCCTASEAPLAFRSTSR